MMPEWRGPGVNPSFVTPVRCIFDDLRYGDDWIVVYPEIVLGNPLGAKNVVRWFLHDPGFHTGVCCVGRGEFHLRFSSATKPFLFPGCHFSERLLEVFYFDFELFNSNGTAESREGTAYCIRKGVGREIQHEMTNSIKVDGLPLRDISKIFRKVVSFYSYDLRTGLSQLAALCGCESVVVPDANLSENDWSPDCRHRYGVAYGIERMDEARSTLHLLKPHLEALQERVYGIVGEFVLEVNKYFDRV
jgi:hypothetical protein